MKVVRIVILVLVLLSMIAAVIAQTDRRPVTVDELFKLKNVSGPQISPDGEWIAYVVSNTDVKADRSNSDIWMVSYDGKVTRQITFTQDQGESNPRWSPDGKYLSFVSSRPGPNRGSQIWVIDRNGGEARQLTEVKGRLQGYEWAPDSKRIAMVIGDPDPEADAPEASRTPQPIVVDRYRFKQDVQGYLRSDRKSYIYLYDVDSKRLDRLTKGKHDEGNPTWSPDGSKIAFTSNRFPDPDRDPFVGIYVADAKPGSTEKRITPEGSLGSSGPRWSPDGKFIAYMVTDEKKYSAYDMNYLTVVASDGSSAPFRPSAIEGLDRGVSNHMWSPDGKSILVFVTDDRSVYPIRVPVTGGRIERLLNPPVVVGGWSESKGRIALLSTNNEAPNEIHVLENGKLRKLSSHNDALLSELELAKTEQIDFTSADGTRVGAMLTYPIGYKKGTPAPLILWIHGGPNAQDQNSFSQNAQLFAANGYAVFAVNYRGSSGRGQKFSRAIAADWGNFEVQDLLAGIDHVVKEGIADPERLGVGGWSYGGILTNYIIATTDRFKAGASGAGTAFTVSLYGVDQYIIQYDYEIGPPWNPEAWETYQKLAYPLLKADRIKTPTIYLGGERDFNVPIAGSEQMYQALRSLGVDTQLIVYPNEFHGISRPSFVRDRYQRYLGWFDKYVLGKTPESRPMIASWEGKWRGTLRDIPAKKDAPKVEVELEIGKIPMTDNACAMWKTSYLEDSVVTQIKDYKLCRGNGADDLFIDEGNGVRIPARVIGDSFIATFKTSGMTFVSTMKLRGEVLEQEILTIDDKPSIEGVSPLNAKGIQKIEVRRVPAKQ